jgi:hypothetical protein
MNLLAGIAVALVAHGEPVEPLANSASAASH